MPATRRAAVGLELAAAHADVLAPHALLARLDHGFNLLAYGPRDLPARQRTLRATIDWSYALLGQPEQALFRRLSAFAGGWTLEEAEGVSPPGAAADVVRGLQILVDHSLVRASSASASGTRFQMLQTIREYGLEQLVAWGEVDDARQSHLTYFQKLADNARARMFGAEQVLWLDALEQELDNLRAALDFARASSDPATLDQGLCLAGTLWRFWYLRCFLSEGRAWLSEFLKVRGSPPARLDALVGLATITSLQTDYDPSVAAAQEGVALARCLDDRLNLSILLNTLAGVARNRDDFANAVALGEESVAVSRSLGDDWSLALSLHNLADVARLQGEYTRGEALAQHSLRLATNAADNWGIAQARLVIGWIASEQGQFETAADHFTECLTVARALGHTRDAALALTGLGQVAVARGDILCALDRLTAALALTRLVGNSISLAQVLTTLGQVLELRGEPEPAAERFVEALALCRQAGRRLGTARVLEALASLLVVSTPSTSETVARLLAQASVLREGVGAPLPPIERSRIEGVRAGLVATLGDKRTSAAWAAGRALSIDQAIEQALAALT